MCLSQDKAICLQTGLLSYSGISNPIFLDFFSENKKTGFQMFSWDIFLRSHHLKVAVTLGGYAASVRGSDLPPSLWCPGFQCLILADT